jgi:hypothetical protein
MTKLLFAIVIGIAAGCVAMQSKTVSDFYAGKGQALSQPMAPGASASSGSARLKVGS